MAKVRHHLVASSIHGKLSKENVEHFIKLAQIAVQYDPEVFSVTHLSGDICSPSDSAASACFCRFEGFSDIVASLV